MSKRKYKVTFDRFKSYSAKCSICYKTNILNVHESALTSHMKSKKHCERHYNTAQNMKFSIKDFFSKCGQIRRKLRIWSHLLKKCLMEKLHFLCSVCFWIPRQLF